MVTRSLFDELTISKRHRALQRGEEAISQIAKYRKEDQKRIQARRTAEDLRLKRQLEGEDPY